ncbi:MAG: hypothetical protein ABIG10_02450 [bacterium]
MEQKDNKKNKRVAIYIDGSNLYHKLKDLNVNNTIRFDYLGFANFLARGRTVTSYCYKERKFIKAFS